ncbi:zinc transporter 1-like [Limulus polyphemus]|uniref:Zinc transporter 1-like n=1 Tax=Limulus polyphemus TaxID=6850 RepID=A0ABM1B3H9_LIMPO|nr:zinc transporter 1-like [Limulus polyphemus]
MSTCKLSKLYVMTALSGFFFGAEIVASHFTRSLVLLADSYHMLYNVFSLLLLIINFKMTKERTLENTFGWARVEVLGVLVNVLFLVALCFTICVESIRTIFHTSHANIEPQYPYGLLTFGVFGLCLNCVCTVLIGGYSRHQGCYLTVHGDDVEVNLVLCTDEHTSKPVHLEYIEHTSETLLYGQTRGLNSTNVTQYSRYLRRMLDFLRDSCSCVLVTIVSYFVLHKDDRGLIKYADPILGLITVAILIITSYPLMKESGLIPLQSVIHHIDVKMLKKRLMLEFPAILNVHDLHVWQLTSDRAIATLHIILNSSHDYPNITYHIENFFRKEGIAFVTVQPEFFRSRGFLRSSECITQCSESRTCGALMCCGSLRQTFTKQLENRCRDNYEPLRVSNFGVVDQVVSGIVPLVHDKINIQKMCKELERQQQSMVLKPNFDSDSFCAESVAHIFKNLKESKETRV